MSCWTIATRQYAMMAAPMWIRTAFSVVPQNFLILRCCLSHLWNSSICYLFLYRLATLREVKWNAFARKAKFQSCSSLWKRTSLSLSGYFFWEFSLVSCISASVSIFLRSRRRQWRHLYCKFLLIRTTEERVHQINAVKFLKSIVATVKHVVSPWFIRDFPHCLGIVYERSRDMEECWNRSLQVV